MTMAPEFSELPDPRSITDRNSAMSALAQVIASANHQVTLALAAPPDESPAEQAEESPQAEPAYESPAEQAEESPQAEPAYGLTEAKRAYGLPEPGQANVLYAASVLHAALFWRPQSGLSDRLKEWLPKLHDVMSEIVKQFEGASWSVTVGAPFTVSLTVNFASPGTKEGPGSRGDKAGPA
jgi:hypothetical protein